MMVARLSQVGLVNVDTELQGRGNMEYKEKEIIVKELEKLPDLKSRYWSKDELEIAWKYRNKDIREVARALGRTEMGTGRMIRRMRRERHD
jgi:hypothetical protein